MTLIIILSLLLLNITPIEANNDVLYQVLEHVNAERQALGRPALRMDGALSAAAQTREHMRLKVCSPIQGPTAVSGIRYSINMAFLQAMLGRI